MTDEVEVLIIGAGPTGLGAAWRLDQAGQASWRLCEADACAGGLAGSVRTSTASPKTSAVASSSANTRSSIV